MLRTLAKSVRQYKWPSIFSAVCVLIEAAAETLIPFYMATMIDQGINAGRLSVIYQMGWLLLTLAAISLTAGVSASWISSYASAGFSKNLRQDMFYHVQDFAFADIDKFSTSSLITRMTTDVTNMQLAYQVLIRTAFRAPAVLIFSVIMAYTVNAEMATIFVVIIPILAVALWWIIKTAQPLFRQVFQAYDELNRVVSENLHGIRVVKTFDRETTEDQKFDRASTGIYNVFTKAMKLISLNAPLMQFVISVSMMLLFWFGARLIVFHGLTTGQLVSLFSYSLSILFSLMMFSMIFNQLTIADAAAERIVAVLKTTPSIQNDAADLKTVDNGAVVFDHVGFAYDGNPDHEVLHDINLTIQSGQFIGIIGATGAGKSSLVELIPRLYDVTEGTVSVAGHNVKDYDLTVLRNNVAMVLQGNTLFSGTIADNLRWGNPKATDEQIKHAAELAQADGFITTFPEQYNTELEQNANNVSGGQKQRIGIAQALLKSPQILIMDDSTSAVDTQTEASIRQALATKIPHTTKIIISQRVAAVQDADLIVMMENGTISQVGTHAQLMAANPAYQQLVQSQQYHEEGGQSIDTESSTKA
ncbi:ABC transporter ATP-binding protein [Levilactobacillus bambusae]|uniref:ABC transporter n=1 Tax=Levilactobacillus bambusae TaxID=2024736 RepID=A0A2V1N0H0_9LACO|nr:ABC transporter ATP-binding protein [Levilactobacillus bambusae]PWG00238.1 hypothetical protein DCM90_04700 [Levilactobacillus bambusae]